MNPPEKEVPQSESPTTEDNLLERIMKYTTNQDIPEEEPEEEVNPPQEEPEESPQEEPETKPEEKQEEKKEEFYTLEELVELGKTEDFSKLNTAKIPPELKAVAKSLEAMATRRQQSLAVKEKQLDELITKVGQPNAQQPQPVQANLDQLAVANPGAAIQQIQTEMAELDTKLKEAVAKDNFFEVQKLLLRDKELKDQERQIGQHFNNAMTEWNLIRQALPDLDEKAPKILEWTGTVLGDFAFTPEEIDALTNPGIIGKTAQKTVRLLHKLYEQALQFETMKTSLEEKLNKEPPTPSEKPGEGKPTKTKSNVADLQKKAQSSGDLDDFADLIGELTKRK